MILLLVMAVIVSPSFYYIFKYGKESADDIATLRKIKQIEVLRNKW